MRPTDKSSHGPHERIEFYVREIPQCFSPSVSSFPYCKESEVNSMLLASNVSGDGSQSLALMRFIGYRRIRPDLWVSSGFVRSTVGSRSYRFCIVQLFTVIQSEAAELTVPGLVWLLVKKRTLHPPRSSILQTLSDCASHSFQRQITVIIQT